LYAEDCFPSFALGNRGLRSRYGVRE
jgi:hypothetical protein